MCLTGRMYAGREADLDMEKASVAEASLMEEPVQALRARLNQLLDDWPEHPILSQLLILCDRLLGALLVPAAAVP